MRFSFVALCCCLLTSEAWALDPAQSVRAYLKRTAPSATVLTVTLKEYPPLAAKIAHTQGSGPHDGRRLWVMESGEAGEIFGKGTLKQFFDSLAPALLRTAIGKDEAHLAKRLVNQLLNFYTTAPREVDCQAATEKMLCTLRTSDPTGKPINQLISFKLRR